jgi:hypothetical protein
MIQPAGMEYSTVVPAPGWVFCCESFEEHPGRRISTNAAHRTEIPFIIDDLPSPLLSARATALTSEPSLHGPGRPGKDSFS